MPHEGHPGITAIKAMAKLRISFSLYFFPTKVFLQHVDICLLQFPPFTFLLGFCNPIFALYFHDVIIPKFLWFTKSSFPNLELPFRCSACSSVIVHLYTCAANLHFDFGTVYSIFSIFVPLEIHWLGLLFCKNNPITALFMHRWVTCKLWIVSCVCAQVTTLYMRTGITHFVSTLIFILNVYCWLLFIKMWFTLSNYVHASLIRLLRSAYSVATNYLYSVHINCDVIMLIYFLCSWHYFCSVCVIFSDFSCILQLF